jgi:DNA-binding transcriptional LysR family regulator
MRIRFSLDELHVFCAVCDAGTLSRGAESVALSMSAVSAKMKGLEGAFGQVLFERSNRGIVLTPAGVRLRKHAQELLQKMQVVTEDMTVGCSAATQLIRLAVSRTTAVEPLIPRLGAFLKQHEGMNVVVSKHCEAEVIHHLIDGRVDMGLCVSSVVGSELQAFSVGRERLVLIVANQHKWAGQPTMSFAETLGADYICPPAGDPLFEELRGRAEQAGGRLRSRIQVSGFGAVARLVASGVGVAAIPEHAALLLRGAFSFAVIPLSDGWADKPLSLFVHAAKQTNPHILQLARALVADQALDVYPRCPETLQAAGTLQATTLRRVSSRRGRVVERREVVLAA